LPDTDRHVVIVGAGIFGVTAALALRARGYEVALLDRGGDPHPDASSTDVSKMIRMDYGSDVFYHELAEVAIQGWEQWNREWPRALYHPEGFLVLAGGPMKPGEFEFESHRVLVERGYSPTRVDRDALASRYPHWNPDRYPDGYLSPRGGWAESGAVVSRLLDMGSRSGVRRVDGAFLGLMLHGSSVRGVRSTAGDLSADTVVVCAGAWTPILLPWLDGVLTPVAQPVLHFGVAQPDQWNAPRFLPFAAGIAGTGWYGFPALADGRLKLGHHAQGRPVPPDERGTVSDRHVAFARSFLRESIPALADAPVVGRRICMYCDSFDGDLLIDRDPDRDGLVVATGGSGHAFKFAPVLGALIADAVDQRANRWNRRFRWRSIGTRVTEQARLGGRPQPSGEREQ
jgi:glycine/D-amino acid oxidase-like deaminating enzyme